LSIASTDYATLIATLDKGGVDFIVIGGVAANAHGSARFTQDVDVVYDRGEDNLERITRALTPLQPYLRGAPPGLPFRWSATTLKSGLNFTLVTSAGSLDLLGEIVGGGTYQDLHSRASRMRIFGRDILVLDLDALIKAKRAAGRPRDFDAIAELELLRDLDTGDKLPSPPAKKPKRRK
jgi:hypothetical protein